MDFRALLEELRQRGQPVWVALPEMGMVQVKLVEVKDDLVTLEREYPRQRYVLHYTSVIVVT